MDRHTKQLHHDIRSVTPPVRRYSVPVRPVLDFAPQRVQRTRLCRRRPTVYRRVSRLLGSLSVLLALLSVGPWGHTISFYNDKEIARDSTFTAGLVDFVLADTPFASVASSTDWEVDVTPHDLSNPFYYYASSSDFMGDDGLCQALTVVATLDGEVMYSGPLLDLLTGTTTVIDTWVFDFNNFEGFAGKSCKFFVDYNGWQTRHGMDEGGYSDTERVMYTITVPSLLLAKVYFTTGDVCESEVATTTATSSDSCNDTQTWVELYNRTDGDIDAEGWQLCASNSCFSITDTQYIDSTVIKAGEFGIVAADPAIHTQISLPLGVTPLITDGVWFTLDLDPAGDMLQLRDPDSLVIDQLNWGPIDLGWANFTSDLWPSNSLSATSGHALARIPVGFDSNEPDDWVLLGVPTLTIDSVDPQILQPGATTTITYTAVNTNGMNSDLRIDIYIFEADDTLHIVELDVENSGEYTFVVPEGLLGPVRIKPVATSPENVLLNARAITEPIPVASSTQPVAAQTDGGNAFAPAVFAITAAASSTESAAPSTASTTATTTTDATTAGRATSTATSTIETEAVNPEEETATSTESVSDATGATTTAEVSPASADEDLEEVEEEEKEEVMESAEEPEEPVETTPPEESATVEEIVPETEE